MLTPDAYNKRKLIKGVKIIEVNPYQVDVKALIECSNQLMQSLYPSESNHLDGPDDLNAVNVYLIGAYSGKELLAIGAVKLMVDDGKYGEIKRLYVSQRARGEGLALQILANLQTHLIALNISMVRLETGYLSIAAINLYKKMGFYKRDAYGHYKPDPVSVFMQKDLV